MPYRPDPKTTATASHCPRCDAPVLVQREGLPFTVTADAAKLTAGAAANLTEPNRLAWCLRESEWSAPRLVMVLPVFHSTVCCHAHVIEHRCPAGTPAVKGRCGDLRTRLVAAPQWPPPRPRKRSRRDGGHGS